MTESNMTKHDKKKVQAYEQKYLKRKWELGEQDGSK